MISYRLVCHPKSLGPIISKLLALLSLAILIWPWRRGSKVKSDHTNRFPAHDFLYVGLPSETSRTNNKWLISTLKFGYPRLTLKEGSKVKSNHTKRFPTHDFLYVGLPSQTSRTNNKWVIRTFHDWQRNAHGGDLVFQNEAKNIPSQDFFMRNISCEFEISTYNTLCSRGPRKVLALIRINIPGGHLVYQNEAKNILKQDFMVINISCKFEKDSCNIFYVRAVTVKSLFTLRRCNKAKSIVSTGWIQLLTDMIEFNHLLFLYIKIIFLILCYKLSRLVQFSMHKGSQMLLTGVIEFNHVLLLHLNTFYSSMLQVVQDSKVLTSYRITNIADRDGWIQSSLFQLYRSIFHHSVLQIVQASAVLTA